MPGGHISISSMIGTKFKHSTINMQGWIDTLGVDSGLNEPVTFEVELSKWGIISRVRGREYGELLGVRTTGACKINFEKSFSSSAPMGGPTQTWNRWRIEGTAEIEIPILLESINSLGQVHFAYKILDAKPEVLLEDTVYQTLVVKIELDDEEISKRLLESESQLQYVLDNITKLWDRIDSE